MPTSRSGPGNARSNSSDRGGSNEGGSGAGRPAKGDRGDPTNKESPDYDRPLDPSVSDDDLTDAEYLRRQGERAKAAIMGAAGAIKASAVGGAKGLVSGFNGSDDGSVGTDDGGIKGKAMAAKDKAAAAARDHPWYTVAGAAGAGFLAALYFDPSRFGRLRGRIKDLEARVRKQERVPARTDAVATQEAAKSKATKTSLWTSLGTMAMGEAVRNLKPFLTDRLGPLMAGLGGHHQDAGSAGGMSPEMMAALREQYGGRMPSGSEGGGPAGRYEDRGSTSSYGGDMPPGAAGQSPPRSAGDPSI